VDVTDPKEAAVTDVDKSIVKVSFALQQEDDWPPFAVECLPCVRQRDGYRIEAPPLFVKELSCGDVISTEKDEHGNVASWSYVRKSDRTTIWLARMARTDAIEPLLAKLRRLKCNTVDLSEYGRYSIDVPAECPIKKVDALLATLDESKVAVVFPSFRHPEP
jgi:hypothetical protein